MTRRRALAVLCGALLLLGIGLVVARVVLLRGATPELVASWLRERAADAGATLTLGTVTAPAPGRLRISALEVTPGSAAADRPRLQADGVTAEYELLAWRNPPVRVTRLQVERLTVALDQYGVDDEADAEMLAESLAQFRKLPGTIAAFLPGARVVVKAGTLRVLDPRGTERYRLDGTEWTVTIAPGGGRFEASGHAWAAAEPSEQGDAQLHWARGQRLRLDLQGTMPDISGGWARATAMWPDLATLPVNWQEGNSTWTASVEGLGEPDWRAEGKVTFDAVGLSPSRVTLTDWAGTCEWSARGVPDDDRTHLDALVLKSNKGDLTARGDFGLIDGEAQLSGALEAYGLTGEELTPWLNALVQPDAVLRSVEPVDVSAATVELEAERHGDAVRVQGTADMGTGALRIDIAPDQPYLRVAQVDATRAEFAYDSADGGPSGTLTVVDGHADFRTFGQTGTGVRGTLGFAPGRLTLTDMHMALPGAEVQVDGDLPFAVDAPLNLTVQSDVGDLAALLAPLTLPDTARIEGRALLSAEVTGTPADVRSTVTIDGTEALVRIGSLVDKRPGRQARLYGVLRPTPEGVVFEDAAVRLPDASLKGSVRAEAAEAGWTWWLVAEGEKMPLPTLRRFSPVTRILRGYGVGDLHFAYIRSPEGRRFEATLDTPEVRYRTPRRDYTFALTDSHWQAVAEPGIARTSVLVRGAALEILDPVPHTIPLWEEVEPRGDTTHGLTPGEDESEEVPWETVVDFTFDTAQWRDVTGTHLTGRVTHARDQVRLERAHARAFGGIMGGSAMLDPDDNVDLAVRWVGCDVNTVLSQAYGLPDVAQGRTHGSVSLYGKAGTWPNWQGSGGLRLELPRIRTAHFTDRPEAVPWQSLSADMAWATFTFDNGTFAIPELAVDREGVHITGSGNINLDGDLHFRCAAQVDNELLDRLPLLAAARFSRPDSRATREVRFSLRNNIRRVEPKLKSAGVGSTVADLSLGTMERSGRVLLDLLGW